MLCVGTFFPLLSCGKMMGRQVSANFAQLCVRGEAGEVRVVVTPRQPRLELS